MQKIADISRFEALANCAGQRKPQSSMSVFNASRFVTEMEYPNESTLRAAFPLSSFHKMDGGWMVFDGEQEMKAWQDFYGKECGKCKKEK